ncbi:GNAT superfamily N-acetyltransferase [Nocardia transvalensis]|uniref:GNAT superfamily N-acetyltransferase n=1 Tax=Nocardia transvalensis TaxID=37333 RepID=A0A7W9PH10_9NOCA|nr:GNAT family N-acetyltransferase [Nocardia transvalensis]MBB5915473.1 GNAT superfamily N-acetyltransferase [Nocardia transvalensis]
MTDDVDLRPLDAGDPAEISAEFAGVGWVKPVEQFLGYLAEQQAGARVCVVAERRRRFAGYCTLVWASNYAPFRAGGIPEVVDLNVLPQHRELGIGNRLMEAVEDVARRRSHTVGLGVGLYADYGAAQRLYVRRGYLPDGRGVVYDNRPVEPGATIRVDDSATLMFTRDLSGGVTR